MMRASRCCGTAANSVKSISTSYRLATERCALARSTQYHRFLATPCSENTDSAVEASTAPASPLQPGLGISTHASYSLVLSLAFCCCLSVIFPEQAQAAEELSPALVGGFKAWLEAVEALGPLGPLVYVATISIVECVPFFPTQPFGLASGLLFGTVTGAFCNLLGLCAASTFAFTVARTFGRDLAMKVIAEETEGAGNAVSDQIAQVKDKIEKGSVLQQFTAILLLRLTPIVPFSATNYVLGLTPVTFPPYIAATALGMTVWATLFASLGGAGRQLLTSGMDLSTVLAEVSEDAGELTENVLVAALGLGVLVLVFSRLPSAVPSPEDLGKPEFEAEQARRRRELVDDSNKGEENAKEEVNLRK